MIIEEEIPWDFLLFYEMKKTERGNSLGSGSDFENAGNLYGISGSESAGSCRTDFKTRRNSRTYG